MTISTCIYKSPNCKEIDLDHNFRMHDKYKTTDCYDQFKVIFWYFKISAYWNSKYICHNMSANVQWIQRFSKIMF